MNPIGHHDDKDTSSSDEIVKLLNLTDIYFWAPVNTKHCLKLVELLQTAHQNRVYHHARYGVSPPIRLYINSMGGTVYEALSVVDFMEQLNSNITTIVTGMAASAATMIAVAGDTRKITKRSNYLIHQLSAVHWGTYEQIKDEQKHYDTLMELIITLYAEKTKVSEVVIKDWLKRETYFIATECLNYGFVDEIID